MSRCTPNQKKFLLSSRFILQKNAKLSDNICNFAQYTKWVNMGIQANYSVSRDMQALVQDIRDNTDPAEKELPRLAVRVLSLFIPFTSPFHLDAFIDQMKSEDLQSRLVRIDNTVANNESEKSDLAIQKQIYTNIKDYTDRARNPKLGIGVCNLLTAWAVYQGNRQLAYSANAWGLTGFAVAVIHRYTVGEQLQSTNRELAERTVKI
jgi:hypothetical protein